MSFHKGIYGEKYMHLYSFSSKLKNIAPSQVRKEYRELGRLLSNYDLFIDE